MLDANARYIPKGVKFFVGGYVDEESTLYRLGVREGQPYLCKMLDNSKRRPRFSIRVGSKVHVVKYQEEEDYTFLVYQGTPNGRGFICDKSRDACEKLIGGFNNTYWRR